MDNDLTASWSPIHKPLEYIFFKHALLPPVLYKCICHFLMCCKIVTPNIAVLAWYKKRKSKTVFSAERSVDNLSSQYISPCLLRQAHHFLVSLSRRITEGIFEEVQSTRSWVCSINLLTSVYSESWPAQPYH